MPDIPIQLPLEHALLSHRGDVERASVGAAHLEVIANVRKVAHIVAASRDELFVAILMRVLEDLGWTALWYRDHARLGSDIFQQMTQLTERSDLQLIVGSRYSNDSEYCRFEYDAGLRLNKRQGLIALDSIDETPYFSTLLSNTTYVWMGEFGPDEMEFMLRTRLSKLL
jgi:hypothetical protein